MTGVRRIYRTPDEAFLARTEPLVGEPGCLIWHGATNSYGYGQIRANGAMVPAHRYAWEREHGPIPAGKVLDHVCHNRACCLTAHLRPASITENSRNRRGASVNSKTGARGVYPNGRRFMAQVRQGGNTNYLGTFDTVSEASEVVAAKRLELFGEFAGGGHR